MGLSLVNVAGRAGLLVEGRVVDVERASEGRFSADPMDALATWDEFVAWGRTVRPGADAAPLDETRLGPPVPRPQKVFGIGVNYRAHAEEAGMDLPRAPMVFTKFPSCLVGPRADVILSSNRVDFEVELVVVIGRGGRRISESQALDHVAGYCVGQDISDRRMQFADKPPQFSMGKSLDTFGPLGPALVSTDDVGDPNDLAICCDVSGERMQDARTSDMIFGVESLIAYLSSVCTLTPGDLIFTGTPSGVGSTRDPRRYLQTDDVVTSTIEHLGTMVNRCVGS